MSLRKDVEMKTVWGCGQLSAVDVAVGTEAGVQDGDQHPVWFGAPETILRARIPSFTVSASI